MNPDLIGGGALLTLIFGSYGFTWAVRREASKGRGELHRKADGLADECGKCRTHNAEIFATKDQVQQNQDRLELALRDMRMEVNTKLDRLTDRLLDQRR